MGAGARGQELVLFENAMICHWKVTNIVQTHWVSKILTHTESYLGLSSVINGLVEEKRGKLTDSQDMFLHVF